MAKETFDESVFRDANDAAAAEDVWGQGMDVPDKCNPQGTFQAEIQEAELGRSQSSDRLQIHYKLSILAGDHKDTIINKYDGLGSPVQTKITQDGLRVLGIDPRKITMAQLPAVLLTLRGKAVTLRCKQNGEFYNIYFQKALAGAKELAKGGKQLKAQAKRTF